MIQASTVELLQGHVRHHQRGCILPCQLSLKDASVRGEFLLEARKLLVKGYPEDLDSLPHGLQTLKEKKSGQYFNSCLREEEGAVLTLFAPTDGKEVPDLCEQL